MMQANTISIILILSCVGIFTSAIILAGAEASNYRNEPNYTAAKKLTKWGILLVILAALMPSTKTIALMYVLPKVTSKEVTEPLGAEAKELYSIAKQALITLSKEKKEEKTKTE